MKSGQFLARTLAVCSDSGAMAPLQIWSVVTLLTCAAAANFGLRSGEEQTGAEGVRGGRLVEDARRLLAENPGVHVLNDRVIFSVFSGQNEVVCTVCVMQILAAAFRLGNDRVQREIRTAFNSPHLDKAIDTAMQVLAKDPTLTSFFRSYYSADAFPRCRPLLGRQLRNKCEIQRFFVRKQGQAVDFQLPATINTINSQVREATAGQISRLFSRLPANTRLVMASALTFSSRWLSQIPAKPGTFQVPTASGRRQQQVTMLLHEDWLPMLSTNDGVQGVSLPYGQTSAVRLFLFRRSSCDDDVRSAVFRQHLTELNRTPAKNNVLVQLPEFDISSKKSDYADLLRQMNVSTMFQQGLGVFEELKVELLAHEARIEVDRDGTRAAGAAGVAVVPFSATPQAFRIVFDCPFVAVLYHSELDLPLFTAYVTNPTVK